MAPPNKCRWRTMFVTAVFRSAFRTRVIPTIFKNWLTKEGHFYCFSFPLSHIIGMKQMIFLNLGQQNKHECVLVWRFLATFTFAICCRPSVCRLSVVVHPTQAVVIFGNFSTAYSTLAIHWHPHKILRRSSWGNPSARGVKHKRGNQI